MKYKIIIPLLFFTMFLNAQNNPDSVMFNRIFDQELSHGRSHENLHELCKGYGKRLSGSPIAAGAVEWSFNKMKSYGFDSVYRQEVLVPHWVRGDKETASYSIKSGSKAMAVRICALGGSIGGKITGKVIEVKSFEELRALGKDKVKGHIVFFNRPMDDTKINTFDAYGGAINQREFGANEASCLGATAVIVRSMSLGINPYPHTGAMLSYTDSVAKIPACAISTENAEMLSKDLKKSSDLLFKLEMHCQWLPDTLSYNVISEIRGTEHPEEIILIGGHLDAWDMAEGAHDDGAGVVQSLEAIRLIKELNIRPRHTIRCVFYMNEENGMRGGLKYAAEAKQKKEKHIAALESDAGGFTPRGFSFEANGDTLKRLIDYRNLFTPYYMDHFRKGGGGVDIGPLNKLGTLLIDLEPDTQRYFDFHHSAADVFEGVNKRELEMGAAGITGLVYLIDKYGL